VALATQRSAANVETTLYMYLRWRTQAVRFLLDHVDRKQVYQALLAAINLGNEDIAETIIEHPKYDEISNQLAKQREGFQQFNDDNQFSEEITPLILASQQNRFEVFFFFSSLPLSLAGF